MWRSLYRLRRFIQPYSARLGLGIGAFGVARLFEAMIPLLLAQGIDQLAEAIETGASVRPEGLLWPVLGIIGAVLGRYLVVTLARYNVRRTGLYVAFDLRQNLFQTLQQQGSQFFNRHSIGDMMTRAVADISLIQRFISMGTILLVILVYATVVGFGFMLYLSPSLTLLLLPPMPFVYYYALWSSRQMGIASVNVQQGLSSLSDQVQENLSGIRTIQAMAQEENEIARFGRANQNYTQAFYRQERISSLMASCMPSLAAVCSITILGYGGYQVQQGTLSVGSLVAFFMYVNMVVQPFRVAGFMVNLFQRAAVASDRLFEVVDRAPEVRDAPSGNTPENITGKIEFENVHFQATTSHATPTCCSDIELDHRSRVRRWPSWVPGRCGQDHAAQAARCGLLQTPARASLADRRARRSSTTPWHSCAGRSPWCPRIRSCSEMPLERQPHLRRPSQRALDEDLGKPPTAADLKARTIEGFPEGVGHRWSASGASPSPAVRSSGPPSPAG